MKRIRNMGRGLRRRTGPISLSVAAAAVTAVAFAAVSVAADDKGGDGDKGDGQGRGDVHRFAVPGPPPLSEEDAAKMEEFRQCMEDNGAPAPPAPPEPGSEPERRELPSPPSEDEIEQIRKAHEACEDKLPEGAKGPGGAICLRGPGGPGGPPPGLREDGGDSRNENQSGVQAAPGAAIS